MTQRWRFLVAYFGAWIPVAGVYALLLYRQSGGAPLSGALWGAGESILFAAVLGLAAWSLTQRLAERHRPPAVLVGAHLLLALAYSVIWTGLVVLAIALLAPPGVLEPFLRYALGWELLTGVLLYGMVAGIAHAITIGARLGREREAATRADALRARAELNALRAQMNPHFLFNTLHSIGALVRTDPSLAEDALERLAALLRRLLDVNRAAADHIALAEEWDIVRDQLELEKLRYGDRLRVVSQVDSEALECLIPVFTLQPLVENAVKHAVASRTEPTTVTVTARVAGDALEIVVADDGPGGDARRALESTGLGLRSIRQRLLAQYGARAAVAIEGALGKGFRVRVTLPAAAEPLISTAERAIAHAPVSV